MDKYSSNTRFPSGLRKKVTELTRNSRIVNPDILSGNRNRKLDSEFRQRSTDPEGTGIQNKFNLFRQGPKNFGLNFFKTKTRGI